MPTAAELSRKVCGEVFAAREMLEVDQWADKYRRVPAKNSVLGGAWNTDLTPYLRRPMRCYTHAAVREITLMFASQLGKTEAIENMKGYTIDMAPANCLVMFGNVETAKNFNEDRFLPSVMLSDRLRRHLLPSAHDVKNGKINFDHLTMYFFGSNSKAGRRGNPIPRVFLDEIDSYDDPEYEEVEQRVKGGDGTHKIVRTSTPGDEGVGIHKNFISGSQEEFYVPCPFCGVFQPLIWRGLTWDGGGRASPDEAAATARYVCQNDKCGEAIRNFHKPEMLPRGVWVPQGRTVEDVLENGEGSLAGTGKGRHTGIEARHVSFHLSSIASPFKSADFGEMAREYVSARGTMTRKFVTGWLGEPHRDPGERMEMGELRRLCIPAAEGGYKLGEVPKGVVVLVRGVDVQKDHVWDLVLGFGPRGRDVWVINFAKSPRREGLNLQDLKLRREFKRVGLKDTLDVRAEYFDSGHFTDEVYLGVIHRRRMGIKANAVKGKFEKSEMAEPWSRTTINKLPDGKPIKGMPELVIVNTDYWKTSLLGRIRGTELVEEEEEGTEARGHEGTKGGEEGTEALRHEGTKDDRGEGEVPGLYLPEMDDAGMVETFIEHVTSEERKLDTGPRHDKRGKYLWKKRPGRPHNHGLDCFVYAMCGADRSGVRFFTGEGKGGGKK